VINQHVYQTITPLCLCIGRESGHRLRRPTPNRRDKQCSYSHGFANCSKEFSRISVTMHIKYRNAFELESRKWREVLDKQRLIKLFCGHGILPLLAHEKGTVVFSCWIGKKLKRLINHHVLYGLLLNEWGSFVTLIAEPWVVVWCYQLFIRGFCYLLSQFTLMREMILAIPTHIISWLDAQWRLSKHRLRLCFSAEKTIKFCGQLKAPPFRRCNRCCQGK
jgi:hypothetical protein